MTTGYLIGILYGTFVTIAVAITSVILASLLGIMVAFAKLSNARILIFFSEVYTSVIRGIPDIVLMLLIYYGGQILLNNMLTAIGVSNTVLLSPFAAGVLTIGFIFGAYMAETFRGAILAIDKGQLEAAKACDLRKFKLFRLIIFPQLVRHGIGSFTNNWLVLIKTTSLVSILGISDMVRIANVASSSTGEPFIFYILVSFIYLGITSLSLYFLRWAKQQYHLEED